MSAFVLLCLHLSGAVSFVFQFKIKRDVREGGWAPVETGKGANGFRAVPRLRPASLSDRKVPRDDAFFHYRPSWAVVAQ